MKIAVELFIIGIVVSMGPCLTFCVPVILSYIAGTQEGWKRGLISILIFSFTQLIVYSILGLLAGLFGKILTERLNQVSGLVFIIGGLFISVIGLLIIFGSQTGHHLCRILTKRVVEDRIKGPVLIGLIIGIIPCLPLLGVLTYIVLKTQNLWQGAFWGFAFGMGKFVSPLIPLGILAGILPVNLSRNDKIYKLFNRLCGFGLTFVGIHLMVSGIWKY